LEEQAENFSQKMNPLLGTLCRQIRQLCSHEPAEKVPHIPFNPAGTTLFAARGIPSLSALRYYPE